MATIFYPPTIPWHRLRQRPHQMLRYLARLGHRCIYHDPATSGRTSPLQEVEPGVFVLSRDALPVSALPESPVILWITLPEHHRLTGTVYGEDFLVFDLCDEPEEEFAYWKSGLEGAFSKAALVFTASYLLYEKYKNMHPYVYYVPNGADYEGFQNSGPRPGDFPQRPGPVAGFHGALASWIDWNLVYHVAKRLPRWNFVFVGPLLNISGDRLPYGKNIFYIKEKPFEELARYTNHFDVGIIPFQVREMTMYSSPVKLYEYLSCGKPVVSSPIHEVAMCPVAKVARNAGEFADMLERTLDEASAGLCLSKRCRSWAKRNSWEKRALWVDKIIMDTLARGLG
ncbi:MAG: glycosyltransferase [Bacillota bacterium]